MLPFAPWLVTQRFKFLQPAPGRRSLKNTLLSRCGAFQVRASINSPCRWGYSQSGYKETGVFNGETDQNYPSLNRPETSIASVPKHQSSNFPPVSAYLDRNQFPTTARENLFLRTGFLINHKLSQHEGNNYMKQLERQSCF